MRKEAEIETTLAAAMSEGVRAWAPGQNAQSRYSESTPSGGITRSILGRKARTAELGDTIEVPRFAVIAVSASRLCLFDQAGLERGEPDIAASVPLADARVDVDPGRMWTRVSVESPQAAFTVFLSIVGGRTRRRELQDLLAPMTPA